MSSKKRRTERNKKKSPLLLCLSFLFFFSFLSFFACFSSTTTITDSVLRLCLQIRRELKRCQLSVSIQCRHCREEMTSYRTMQIFFFFFFLSARLSSSAEVYLNASFYYLSLSLPCDKQMYIKSSFQIDIRLFENKTPTCHRQLMLIHVLLNNEKVSVKSFVYLFVHYLCLFFSSYTKRRSRRNSQ